MNSSGGSFIKQADGSLLQVEGLNMNDDERAAAKAKAEQIVADAQKAAEAQAASPVSTNAAAIEAAAGETEGGRTGRTRTNATPSKE
ncbi:hypothetical protein [Dongia sp.]|uniref:hypothetical protein n=1 Tax=Dongia sp. TaxID=1977262 RepID=UPI0035B3C3BF